MGRIVPDYDYRYWTVEYGPNGSSHLLNESISALCASEPHFRKPNGSWSGGGPFLVLKRSLIHRQGDIKKNFRSNGVSTDVSCAGSGGHPTFALPAFDKNSLQSIQDVTTSWSLPGYNNTRPGMPEADLLVAVKELVTDGFPSIPLVGSLLKVPLKDLGRYLHDVVKRFKDLGSEYLNVVFGWKPFINDLRKLVKLAGTLDEQLAKLVAQNGHVIRRRALLRDTSTTTQETTDYSVAYANVYGGSGVPNAFGNAKTHWTRTTKTWERIWYSACYRYWIPNPLSAGWRLRAAAILSGSLPTPGNLLAAMPWSWLADWFSSVGGIATALSPSAVDNLVQLWGYTMRSQGIKITCNSQVQYPKRNTVSFIGSTELGQRYSGCDQSYTTEYVDETKSRVGGFHPFGPDKTSDGFSPYQISVLAALGLTRS